LTEQTYGQRLVRVQFNPAGSTDVDALKTAAATLIDLIWDYLQKLEDSSTEDMDLVQVEHHEHAMECLSIAISRAEECCMWAVKGLTS